jgi:hypothetical protein
VLGINGGAKLSRPKRLGGWRPAWAGVVWTLLLVGFIVASWYPFQLDPPRRIQNDADRTAGGGWTFGGEGLAVTDATPGWLVGVEDADRLVIDVEFRTAVASQHGPARLVSLAPGAGGGADIEDQNLVIGQQGQRLQVRFRRVDVGGHPQARVLTPRIEPDTWHRVRVEADERLVVEFDGEPVTTVPFAATWAQAWQPDALLSLGNTPSGTRPWTGELRRAELTIDGTTTDLLAEPRLVVPDPIWVVPARLTSVTDRTLDRSIGLWTVHLLVGVALGGLLASARPHWRVATVIAVLVVLVAVVNVGKIVVATRHPSSITALLQVLGIVCGAMVIRRAIRRRAVYGSTVGGAA